MSTDAVATVTDGGRKSTVTVLDAADIRRDWRHTWAERSGITTALTSGGALISAVLDGPQALTWTLATLTGPAALALLTFIVLMAREGRRWTYTTDVDEP